MVASSISTPDSALPIVVSTSKLIEFNGKHFIPSPSLEAKTKKLWEAQVMIPYSFSEKSLAFAGPIRTNPPPKSFSFFSKYYRRNLK